MDKLTSPRNGTFAIAGTVAGQSKCYPPGGGCGMFNDQIFLHNISYFSENYTLKIHNLKIKLFKINTYQKYKNKIDQNKFILLVELCD